MSNPQPLWDNLYRWKPNRATAGGSSYLLRHPEGNILIDTPAHSPEAVDALQALGGVAHWFFTHRGGIGEVDRWWKHIQPQIFIHEQEAFLVNAPVAQPFTGDCAPWSDVQVLWTPGHSPGSSCLLYRDWLFTGRHLLPDAQGLPRPLRLAKTFHWPRQLRSVQKLLGGYAFNWICPGAAVGLLRGAPAISNAQEKLQRVWQEIASQQQ